MLSFQRGLKTDAGAALEAERRRSASKATNTPAYEAAAAESCGPLEDVSDDEQDMVPMIDDKTGEWNGPTRGGTRPEPTRYGDWERNGRVTDF